MRFEKTIAIFEINPPPPPPAESGKMQSFLQNKKIQFGNKNALFEYFWDVILKNYRHIYNQHPQLCQTAKFRAKITIHCTENVQIQSFFWSVFSRIQSKHGKIRTRKNSVFGHFLRSDY